MSRHAMTVPKILIVDDDASLRSALEIRFCANGFVVATAGDAVHAVSLARRVAPDVILLDIGMPAGSGFTVYDRIRKLPETAATPVVFMTGDTTAATEAAVRRCGAYALLTKPLDGVELLHTVRCAIAEQVNIRHRALDELQIAADRFTQRRPDAA